MAFADERFGDATSELVGAARSAPTLLGSPIWGPQLILSLSKAAAAAALPGSAGRRVRQRIKQARTRMGRNPVEPEVPPTSRGGP